MNLPSEATVDSFLQQQFGYQEGLSWRINSIKPASVAGMAEVTAVMATAEGQQLFHFFVAPDGEHAVVGDIIPFGARPFDPVKKMLDKGITGPDRGPKNSPVTIVEFGDLQCPACKAAQPTIEALIAVEPTAHFVFQNFPLEMHNWAAKGAAYADCVGRASNDAFWKFISKTYETQADITAATADEKLTAIADQSGRERGRHRRLRRPARNQGPGGRVDCFGQVGGNHGHADALHQRAQNQQLRPQSLRGVQEPGGFRRETGKLN